MGGIGLNEYGGVFGIGSAISVGLHNEEAHKAIITVPPISGMYHSQGELNPLYWETSEITKREDTPDVIDLIVIRNGMQISVCANGESILDFTDVEFWEPGLMWQDVPEIPEDPPNDHWSRGIRKLTNSYAAVSELPFCEKDGAVSLGYKVPQHWTSTGGQPPSTHTWSANGIYHYARYSSDAYTTCADAQTALDFESGNSSTTTLPYKSWENADPTTTFSSSLGSVLHVGDETTIQATANDPDGDEVHLTVVYYGLAPEMCDWPQCNSKTSHATGAGDAVLEDKVTFVVSACTPRLGKTFPFLPSPA